MLASLRRGSKGILAKLLLGLLVLSFAVWGIGDILQDNVESQPLVTLDGATIDTNEYDNAMRNVSRRLGARYSPELIEALGIPDQVLNELINNKLLSLEAKRFGVRATEDHILPLISQNQAFHDESGNFSPTIFATVLRQAGVTEKRFAEDIKRQLANEILMKAILSSELALSEYVNRLHVIRNEERTISLFQVNSQNVEKPEIPDNTILESFYKNHSYEFMAPEYRSISYLVIDPEALRKDITITDDELEALYNERINGYRVSEQREVERLLFDSEEQANKAKEQADKGTSFAKIGKQLEALNPDSVSLGLIDQSALPTEHSEAIFSSGKGQITPVIASDFGWHIYKVIEINEAKTLSLAEIAPKLKEEITEQRISGRLVALETILDDTLASGATLEEAAEAIAIPVQTLPPVSVNGMGQDDTPKANTSLERDIIGNAFNQNENEISSILIGEKDIRFAVRTDSILPERTKALDEVKGAILEKWQELEFAKNYDSYATSLLEQLRNGKTAKQLKLKIAQKATIKRDGSYTEETSSNIVLPNEIVKSLFSMNKGEYTVPFYNQGTFYISKLNKITEVSLDETNADTLETEQNGLSNDLNIELFGQYILYLRKAYDIRINQELFATIRERI
jgi:peptidyl-prolyl cis-trans isomerase D